MLKKLWRWAVQSGRVDADPMAKLQPADEWGVNAEHLRGDAESTVKRFYIQTLEPGVARVVPDETLIYAPWHPSNWPELEIFRDLK